MQIAEDLVKTGATTGAKFNSKLTEFVAQHKFTKLIETGTMFGTGTTRAILNGLSGDYKFISIEADPEHFKIAKRNLRGVKGIHLVNGLSIGRPDLPVSISAEFPEFVVVDHQPKNRLELYLKEVGHNVHDHALNIALAEFDFRPEFVMLDSAGYMGTVEFKYLMDRVKGPFYLALDDTDHIKHFDTMQYIRNHPEKFEIIWEVRSEYNWEANGHDRDKFGSAIISVS